MGNASIAHSRVLDTQEVVIKYKKSLYLLLFISMVVTQNKCHLGHLNEWLST